MTNADRTRLQEQVEALIDAHGLYELLDATGMVCFAKGSHLRENWQDSHMAKAWDSAGKRVSTCAANQACRIA